MKTEEARHKMTLISRVVTQLWEMKGRISPMFHYGKKDGTENVITPALSSKDMVAEAMREILQLENAVWVLMITEAWIVSTRDKDYKVPVGGLEHVPGREEVIMYQLEDQDLGMITAQQKIERDVRGEGKLGELTWLAPALESKGRMVGLLPQHGLRH